MQPFFFAQARTTSEATQQRVWYVVAVERNASGAWKLAFVSWGSYQDGPPLQSVTRSEGYTPAVTEQAHARITHLALATAGYMSGHNPHVATTSWGATIHGRITVDPHDLVGSSLQQGPTQSQWGFQLPPGSYSSITSDTAEPTCAVGTGVGSASGRRIFSDDHRVVGTTGVPA